MCCATRNFPQCPFHTTVRENAARTGVQKKTSDDNQLQFFCHWGVAAFHREKGLRQQTYPVVCGIWRKQHILPGETFDRVTSGSAEGLRGQLFSIVLGRMKHD
jgi:hypothetical protein